MPPITEATFTGEGLDTYINLERTDVFIMLNLYVFPFFPQVYLVHFKVFSSFKVFLGKLMPGLFY